MATNRYGDFGDELSSKICEYLTGNSMQFSEVARADLIAAGSLLEPEHAAPTTWDQFTGYIWGVGRLREDGVTNLFRAQVWAVRSHLTLNNILCEDPDAVTVGDPRLLAHMLARGRKREFKLGFVPHWSELEHPVLRSGVFRQNGVRIIDPCEPV